MPSLAPIPPHILKRILELDGWAVITEDFANWVMVRSEDLPVILPKLGDLVAVDVLMNAVHRAQMNNARYLELLDRAKSELGGWNDRIH